MLRISKFHLRDQDSGYGFQILAHKMDRLLVFTIEFICNDVECQKKYVCMQHSK